MVDRLLRVLLLSLILLMKSNLVEVLYCRINHITIIWPIVFSFFNPILYFSFFIKSMKSRTSKTYKKAVSYKKYQNYSIPLASFCKSERTFLTFVAFNKMRMITFKRYQDYYYGFKTKGIRVIGDNI